jgi:hypothetical protein
MVNTKAFRRQNHGNAFANRESRRILKTMSRVSGATVKQSVPVSSSVAVAEEPEINTGDVKQESSKEVNSHSGAQKQNAVTRRSENDLTAMLQKERITEIPRAHIKKEELDYLSKALNSKNDGTEGVKLELTATFKNNGPGQHAKIAECMRQFAAAGTKPYGEAYLALKKEMGEWTKFDRTGMSQPAQRNFFNEVAYLRGPGSARVKADLALMIQNNIEQAKHETTGTGLRAYAGMYTGELGKLLQSTPSAIFRTLENDPVAQKAIPGIFDNLLNFKEGHKAIAAIVIDMAAANTRMLLLSPSRSENQAYQLGRFLAHVESGIERNAKTREQAIEMGASILTYGLKAAEQLTGMLLGNGSAKGGFQKVREAIEWLKNRDIASVEEARKHLTSTMKDLVDATFVSIADPYGNLAAQAAERNPGLVALEYEKAVFDFQRELMHGRRDVLER